MEVHFQSHMWWGHFFQLTTRTVVSLQSNPLFFSRFSPVSSKMQLGAHLLRSYAKTRGPVIAPSAMPSTAELAEILAEELRLAEESLLKQAQQDDEAALAEPDYDTKVSALHSSMTTRMVQAVELGRKSRIRLADESRAEMAAAAAVGVDLELLADIKAAFDAQIDSRGTCGVTEDEFIKSFGPALCAGLKEDEIRLWFRMIDSNCNGSIAWQEISKYVGEFKSTRTTEAFFVDYTIEATGVKATKRPHRQPIGKLLVSSSINTIYSAAPDGLIHCWHTNTMRSLEAPVHSNKSIPVDISLCPHNNRLIVLQADSAIFVYDAYCGTDGAIRHELWRGFACPDKAPVKVMYDGSSFYENTSAQGQSRSRFLDHAVTPVTQIAGPLSNMRCIDQFGGHVYGEPVVVGHDAGTVSSYLLTLGSHKPLMPSFNVKAHSDWVTAIKFAPELRSVLSCSLDGKVCVLDVESQIVMTRMAVPDRMKPLYHFEYHGPSTTLATWGARDVHVWNALTGARLTTLSEHDSPVVNVVLGADRNQLFALMNNKTVKVWDLRTWRSLGTAEDPMMRPPTDTLTAMTWCDREKLLVSGCTELFGWRPLASQRHLDAGMAVGATAKQDSHIYPITDAIAIAATHHITSMDQQRVIVWGTASQEMLTAWTMDNNDVTTAASFDCSGLRLVLGTENGHVKAVNYANGYVIQSYHHDLGNGKGVSAVLCTKGMFADSPDLIFAAIGTRVVAWSQEVAAGGNPLTSYDIAGSSVDNAVPPSSHHAAAGGRVPPLPSIQRRATAAANQSSSPSVAIARLQRHAAAGSSAVVTAMCLVSQEKQVIAVTIATGDCHLLSLGLTPLAVHSLLPRPNQQLPVGGGSGQPAATTVESLVAIFPSLFVALCSDGRARFAALPKENYHVAVVVDLQATHSRGESLTAAAVSNDIIFFGDADGVLSAFRCSRLLDEKYVRKELLPRMTTDAKPAAACGHFIDLLFSIKAHRGKITAVCVDAGMVITASDDKSLRAWKPATGEEIRTFGSMPTERLSKDQRTVFADHAFMIDTDVTLSDAERHRRQFGAPQGGGAGGAGGATASLPAIKGLGGGGGGGPSLAIRGVPSLSFAAAPGRTECFNLATQHVMDVRRELVREVPMRQEVHECLQEVARMRDARGETDGPGGTEPARAFTELWLPPVPKRLDGDSVVNQKSTGGGRRGGTRQTVPPPRAKSSMR